MTNSTPNAPVEPATAQVEWLEDAARYFEARPTLGEDMAHWANVHNAEMCRKIAAILAVRLDEAAIRKDEREKCAKIAERDIETENFPERLRRRAALILRWNDTSSPERHKTLESEAVETAPELIAAADLLESQARALSEATRRASELEAADRDHLAATRGMEKRLTALALAAAALRARAQQESKDA